ncbi:hypothetical protein [uncultured Campylobacter sp.]|uniref:hypothetical protein n=1 Tax=uncultured Campylobacter sp. TaxID=218934 RepID=UPI0025D8F47B|nr:hypothetical protein [uncultured Campylobacter sp.]
MKLVPDRKTTYITQDDICYYFLDYLSGGGYSASKDNDLIFNFKKDIRYKNTNSWAYKMSAVKQFADMLHGALGGRVCTIIPMPTSKPRGSQNFDDRLDQVALMLGKISANYDIQLCLDVKEEYPAAHRGGERSPDALLQNIILTPPSSSPKNNIILIDDVLTSGGHFKAAKAAILAKYPDANVIGFFLGKTIYIEPVVPAIDDYDDGDATPF